MASEKMSDELAIEVLREEVAPANDREREALAMGAAAIAVQRELVDALRKNVRWAGAVAFTPNTSQEGRDAEAACKLLVRFGYMREGLAGVSYEWVTP